MKSSRELPSGTVTLLFTDIERSTDAAAALGDELFAAALKQHRNLMRPFFRRYNGTEMSTVGDSCLVAFWHPSDAAYAAIEAQHALEAHEWPQDIRLRVRMGIHTGEVLIREGEYIGHAVHKAKRISDAGHGGQVLLSQTTADLIGGRLPDSAKIVDLGSHRLKDLGGLPIHQLVAAGLQAEFPRLRTLEGPNRNIPVQLTTFVGRERELAEIRELLDAKRLITLTGPGGVGKTRLAIEAARDVTARFVNRVWFVDLTAAVDGSTVLGMTAAALEVQDEPGRATMDSLVARLGASPSLLVVDNCEQVVGAVAALITEVLSRVPELRILATSREVLGLPGETVLPTSPLEVPAHGLTEPADLAENHAIRLFVDRASAADPGFALGAGNATAVASICRRLDGLPLAVELAAAQAAVLGPGQLDRRLWDRFALLRSSGRGRPPRHQGLAAVLDWSYGLLDDDERAVLDRLAVFRGTFSLDAVEAVAAGDPVDASMVLDILTRLARKSLVVAEDRGSDRRYRLLETVREYGRQRLETAGELNPCRNKHYAWVLDLTARAAKGLAGNDQVEWLDALDDDLDNIEGALAWSLNDPDRAARALDAVLGLHIYWMARGTRRAQGIRWSNATAAAATRLDNPTRTKALMNAVLLVIWSDLDAASALSEAAERLAGDDSLAHAYAGIARAHVECFRGDASGGARANRAAAMFDQEDRHFWAAQAVIALDRGHAGAYEEGHKTLMAVARRARETGDEHLYGAWQAFAADIIAAAGENTRARDAAKESLEIARRLSCASCESQALSSLVLVDPCEDLGGAVAAARRAVELTYGIGEVFNVLCALEVLAGAMGRGESPEDAVRVASATAALRAATGFAPILPGRATLCRDGVSRARDRLDAREFKELWDEGESLDYEAVVRLALDRRPASARVERLHATQSDRI